MYLAIDVGGTKTLIAVLNEHGVIREKFRFPTPHNYHDFLSELKANIKNFEHQDYKAAGVGIPVSLYDRKSGIAKNFSNLPWRNVKVAKDIRAFLHCPVVVENDAKLAALSESRLFGDAYTKVLYVTISTGIGFGLIVDGKIDPNIGDDGGASLLIEHQGKNTPWEKFASGQAIYKKYGKKASEINDQHTWQVISRNIAKGLITLISITEPDIIVIGGGVGTHFEKFGDLLEGELKKYDLPLINMPKIIGASRPEDAVVYGCYDYAKENYK
ncbi:ROK family protein [bacterium]|jgi:glucokinase|nr:ROK family protein [bacterium]